MGKVTVKIKLTSSFELAMKRRKLIKVKPRTIETEALVDVGATRLYLQTGVIKALGLRAMGDGITRVGNGRKRGRIYEPVRLEIQGRYGTFNVVDIGNKAPNRVGCIPLAHLDFVLDSKNRKLIPNPEHGDKQMSEEY